MSLLRLFAASRFLRVCLITLASAAPEVVSGQASMQPILTNGPVSNRLNIVVLSEGYTSGDLAQFPSQATNAINVLLSHSPFQEYRSYFNAFAIRVPSNASGSDHPLYGTYRDTYFNSYYDSSDYLIEIPADGTGQGKVDALLQTFLPRCHLPLLLVNDATLGGSDGFARTAIVSTGGLGYDASIGEPGILTHEVGHVLANLGDEYSYDNPGFPNTEEPNTTQETNRLLIKWKVWIAPTTPVPTPVDYGDGVVGLFQGAHYHATNWYRPQVHCVMNSLGVPFCAVCSEALVVTIYQKVRPVEAVSPLSTNLSVTTTQALAFSLTLLQPATHALTVQWYTNNVPVPGATNPAFMLLPATLGNGSNNVVKALVRDTTALVRNDPTNLLSQTITWNASVAIPQLRLGSPLWLTGGKFAFRVSGSAPQAVVVHSSTNLVDWSPVATNSLVGGQFWYTNSTAASSPRRFYRATTPP